MIEVGDLVRLDDSLKPKIYSLLREQIFQVAKVYSLGGMNIVIIYCSPISMNILVDLPYYKHKSTPETTVNDTVFYSVKAEDLLQIGVVLPELI